MSIAALRQGIFHMKDNQPVFNDGSRGSILLVSSTSGYFGGTGVAGYITSKHGITGMLRGSQLAAKKHSLRINAVAPFVTPTAMSAGFSTAWKESGLPMNTMEAVARVIGVLAMDPSRSGSCYLVCTPASTRMIGKFNYARPAVRSFERWKLVRKSYWVNGSGMIWLS